MPLFYSWALPRPGSMAGGAQAAGNFPLQIDASGRFLRTAAGTPWFSILDSGWLAAIQLTQPTQIDAYVADLSSRGFNGVIMQLMDPAFATNAPNNIDNVAPLTTSNDFSTPNNTYFNRVDYFVNACKNANIVVWMWPLYVGLQPGGSEGWSSQFEGNTQAKRQAWGTFVANRYTPFGNVVFVNGGDGTVSSFAPYNDYIDKITAAMPGALMSYHAARTVSGFTAANAQTWFNLNSVYTDSTGAGGPTLTEYGRSPIRPVGLIEMEYETASSGGSGVLNDIWASVCSGGIGYVAYGHEDIWRFGGVGGDPNFASHYGDPGRAAVIYMRNLSNAYSWWKGQPVVDTSVVTTSLGTGAAKICPLVASDFTFAWIYSPSANFTLNKAAFSGAYANIRIRAMRTDTGAFSTISASTPTSGTQAITVSNDSVIVVDGG